VKIQKLGDWAAAENLLKLKEKTKGDFQRGKGLGNTYISGSIHIWGSGVYILATSVSSSCGWIVGSGSGFCQIFF